MASCACIFPILIFFRPV
uniref:Uncharacterized protein n=1 Tax=Rhizophora mucronata TaxID=61149 RepID=A0A2P2R475_RHIMU